MQNLAWKVLLIVVVILLSLWAIYPPKEKIRLGKDLRGGVSLLYVVKIPESEPAAQAQTMLTQVINVLKDRVNPQGLIDISFQPQGRDRIEIVMPLPGEEVNALRAAYDKARRELLSASQIDPLELDTALTEGTAVTRYGAGSGERAALVQQVQDAFVARKRAEDDLAAAQKTGVEPDQLGPKEQAVAEAEIAFDQLRERLLRQSLDERRLRSVLALPTEPKFDRATREPIPDSSPRDVALAHLKQEFTGLDLDPVVKEHDAYVAKRTGFDDPEDLMRLLRGAGVLEFYIAVQNSDPAKPVDVEDLRRQLMERGPENVDSPLARWFPINDLKQWYEADEPRQLEALQADPVAYFAQRNLVAASKDGQYYVMLYTGPGKSMTHAPGLQWTIENARPTQDSLGRPAVQFQLDQSGGSLMSQLTGPHVNQPMAIVLDGQVYSAPNLNSRIGRNGIIEGSFSESELNYLMRVLAAGALEARLSPDPISINTIGPSLGRDNLDRGLWACVYSALAVGAFMIIYYFFPGLVAVIAVLAHVLLTFAIMAALSATFTLPGLAGIALSVGMAVDANVLVYERIREEFARGHDLRAAIRLGYQRALTAIVDGNICNMLVCLFLYWTATAEVKGFALTMICGVATTLFTSLTMTRVTFELVLRVIKPKSFPTLPTASKLLNRFLHPHIDWIGLRRVFLPVSCILVLASIAMTIYVGKDLFDTEFRGGVSATMHTRLANTAAGEPVAADGHLAMARGDVEHRVRAIGERAGEANPVLHELRRAAVVSVGESRLDPATGQLLASAFQLKIASSAKVESEATATQTVVSAIVEEFRKELDARSALTFRGAGATQGEELAAALKDYTFPITQRTLGENINRPEFTTPVQNQLGGVIVLLQDISPPATEADLTQRIHIMREQPDFSDSSGRLTRVVGLDPADPSDPGRGFTSAAVIVSDSDVNYQKVEFATWETRLAKNEWRLASQALQRGATLEQVSSFSSAVADTLKANALVAVVLSLAGILVYIWIRFNSLLYSAAAVACLVHDVAIAIGLLALSHVVADTSVGSALLIEDFRIDMGVIAALLTLNGYSLNDTIVVMDRIRENRGKRPLATAAIINDSINQTFSRTIITSFTVFLSTLVLYIQGGTGIRPFAFCFLIGVVAGTYSSIAIAAPIVVRRQEPKDLSEQAASADRGRVQRLEGRSLPSGAA